MSGLYLRKNFHIRKTEPKDKVPEMKLDEDIVSKLANLAGIPIYDNELEEVTSRFESLMLEMERLKELDLSDILPVVIFPEDGEV